MVELATYGRLLAGIVLLLGNGYFVTIEFAMTRVRQFSKAEFQGSAGLRRAWEMTNELEIYLSGCQLGITICSVGLGVVAEPALAAVLDPLLELLGVGSAGQGHSTLSVLLALGVINLMHVVLGEQAPTYLGIERTQFVAKYGAPILYWWTTILGPVIRLADWIAKGILSLFGVTITRSWAEEELEEGETDQGARPEGRADVLRRMGSILSQSGMTDERQQEVMNAIAIDRLEVEDIMVPPEDIVAISTTEDVQTNIERIQGTPHTRFPLVGEDIHDRIGIVYIPALVDRWEDLQTGGVTFESVAVEAMTVGPDTAVADLIDEFQANAQELALVVDDGQTVGLVTITDAFEAIAGDVEDPMDEAN